MCKRIKIAYKESKRWRAFSENRVTTFCYFLFGNGRFASAHRFRFGRMRFFARYVDSCPIEEIIIGREYDFISSWFESRHAPVVLDLGANIGLFSLFVFNVCPAAEVYSIEPAESTYRILARNRRTNPDLNWHVLNYAIWSEDGRIGFVYCPDASSSSYANDDSDENSVPAISLRSLLERIGKPVDLLKMDIEGAEERVLEANQDILGKIDAMIVEIHPHRCDQEHVIQILRESYKNIRWIERCKSKKPLLFVNR